MASTGDQPRGFRRTVGRRVAAALLATLAGAAAAQDLSGRDFPLVDPTLGPAPGWKASAPLPEKLQGNLAVTVRSREAIGTFNAPACQTGEWTLRAELVLRLARKSEQTAEYEAVGGSWKVAGTCRGTFAESFPGEVCTATVDGRDSGAGSFAPGEEGLRLTLHRDTGVFELAIDEAGKATRAWRYDCAEPLPWPKRRTDETETTFAAGVNGHVLVRGPNLVFDVGGAHAWVNDLVQGQYTRTSGGFLGSGPDCEYLRKEIERVRNELDRKKPAAEAQQRALLAGDPAALAELSVAAAHGTIPAGLDALASAAIQKEMAALPGVGGGDGEAYFRSLSGYLSGNAMPLPLPLDPALLPALGQGQAARSSLATAALDGRVSFALLDELRRQLDRCSAAR